MDKDNVKVIKQGHQISKQMKMDIIDLYWQSMNQREYKDRAEFMRSKLEDKYGRMFSIMIVSNDSQYQQAFLYADDLLFEFKTDDHVVMVYLAPLPQPPSPTSPRENYNPERQLSPHHYDREPVYHSRIRYISPPRSRIYHSPPRIITPLPPLIIERRPFYDRPLAESRYRPFLWGSRIIYDDYYDYPRIYGPRFPLYY